jgi:hypothetical protein
MDEHSCIYNRKCVSFKKVKIKQEKYKVVWILWLIVRILS